MKPTDMVADWMTRSPHTLASTDTVDDAYELFRKHGFRHVPVMDGATLVGIVSERDLFVAAKFTPTDAMKLEVIMSPEPYVVAPNASLVEVAGRMQGDRRGAAVVVDDGRVVGVFTAEDALRCIAGANPPPPPEVNLLSYA